MNEMPVTPRSRTASASASPFKSNGRQNKKITIDSSDDETVEEKKPRRGRASAAKETIEVVDDDEDDDEEEGDNEYEVEVIRGHRAKKGTEAVSFRSVLIRNLDFRT